MKKNIIATVIAFAAALMTISSFSITASAFGIPFDDAKTIAIGNAGVNEEDVIFIDEGTETINGITQYAIIFQKGQKEYIYQINAETGEILYSDLTVL